jgi:hypothetical protein
VADRVLKLQEKEERVDLTLDHELEALASHESNLNSREATLEAGQKSLEETRTEVLGHELTAGIRDQRLNSRVVELASREKRLAERRLQELATTQRMLEEL